MEINEWLFEVYNHPRIQEDIWKGQKIEITTECPTCKESFTRMQYAQMFFQYPGVLGLEMCPNCSKNDVVIKVTKRYD